MGFQSSFNQLLATASAGALGYKHISEAKQSNKLNALNQAESLNSQIKEHNEQFNGTWNATMAAQRGGTTLINSFKSGKMSEEAFVKALEANNNEIKGRIKQLTDLSVRGDMLRKKKDIIAKSLSKSEASAFIEKPMSMKGNSLDNFMEMTGNKKYEKAGKK